MGYTDGFPGNLADSHMSSHARIATTGGRAYQQKTSKFDFGWKGHLVVIFNLPFSRQSSPKLMKMAAMALPLKIENYIKTTMNLGQASTFTYCWPSWCIQLMPPLKLGRL